MKKLYEEYFYIPEDGKIRDKVMVVRVAVTVAVMLACLFAMTFSAYAYFSHSVTSNSNVIKSADYDLTVTLTPDTGAGQPTKTYSLDPGTYSVKLTKAGSANTGFCVIEVKIDDNTTFTYHTQQIGTVGDNPKSEITFSIVVPAGNPVSVKFIPHWGTSIYYSYDTSDTNPKYVRHGGTVNVGTGNG